MRARTGNREFLTRRDGVTESGNSVSPCLRVRLLTAVAGALALLGGSARCETADETLPARDLRGYGLTQAARHGNVTVVTAETPEKALLWADVRLPEIAEFAGFGPDATDLKGTWQRRPVGATGEWSRVEMPGHQLAAFLPKEAAVYRRAFDLPARAAAGARTWHYVWDLSRTAFARVGVRVNGTSFESFVPHGSVHWMVREVTDALRPGRNGVELTLPTTSSTSGACRGIRRSPPNTSGACPR